MLNLFIRWDFDIKKMEGDFSFIHSFIIFFWDRDLSGSGSQPVRRDFHKVYLSDSYIIIHNISKVTVMK